MKRNKRISKYNKPKLDNCAPICPICGEHAITTESELTTYKLDGKEFTINEQFFRCFKNPGEQYATAEMVKRNTNALRSYLLKKELDKKEYRLNTSYNGRNP
jgi:hypothetical protein